MVETVVFIPQTRTSSLIMMFLQPTTTARTLASRVGTSSVPCVGGIAPDQDRKSGRALLAMSRLEAARGALEQCEFCMHGCGVNRWEQSGGACHAGSAPRVFSAQIEVGDELELLPVYAIALSGCNMRCVFCVTGSESWCAGSGRIQKVSEMAASVTRALREGTARTVLILGGEPTVHLPWLLEFAARMPQEARLVLKTNGICTKSARDLLRDVFNVWLVDFKFWSDECAAGLAKVQGYRAAVAETLKWAASHGDLIVRHLLLPGHVECCWKPIAAWLATDLSDAKVSLRFGYWPAWKAQDISGMNRPVSVGEQERAIEISREFNLRLIP